MAFVFTHDGLTFRLDTEGGEVHCKQVDQPEQPKPIEPSDDEVAA